MTKYQLADRIQVLSFAGNLMKGSPPHEGSKNRPPSPDSPEERRHNPRYPLHLRVLVASGQSILHGRTENISIDGACIRLDEIQPEGGCLPVRFLTPYIEEFSHIDVMARVQYSAISSGTPSCKVGVHFIRPDPEIQRRISMVIRGAG